MTDTMDPMPDDATEAPSRAVAPGPVPAGAMARAGDGTRPNPFVGFTNWLVHKASGVLEKRTSRRGFLVGSAMVGSAVAVSGCMVATQPGSPYSRITDCNGGLCSDGYTEFCCVINDGVNACPPDSFAGGWWRADYSSWCNGTRYYIDCMQYCCGPKTGYQNFCAGCQECRCAGGCNDTRKVYCNYFRYGQCHQEITETGPIACRIVTCVPPYQNDEWACSTAAAVDNSTAEHPARGTRAAACLETLTRAPVLPSLGAIVDMRGPGGRMFGVAARTMFGTLNVQQFNGLWWYEPTEVLNAVAVDSGVASATDDSGAYVFARGYLGALFWNRFKNDAWQGSQVIAPRGYSSDPVALKIDNSRIRLFIRSNASYANEVLTGDFVNGNFQGWQSLQGFATSNLAAVQNPNDTMLFSRGYDGALWWNRAIGGSWRGWQSLGGIVASDPSAVSDGSNVYVFVRTSGRGISYRRFNGSWSSWQHLGGSVLGDPKAYIGIFGPTVLARADDGQPWYNDVRPGQGTDWKIMWNPDTTGANPLGTFNPSGSSAFMVGRSGRLYHGTLNGPFSGWGPLGPFLSPVTAA